ncbi:conserved hypothetical protein [Burkholderia cenocepacia]|nr:conserved hypothetical protein [Burkholderia cenocepacia]
MVFLGILGRARRWTAGALVIECLLDHLRHEIEAVLDGRRRTLVVVAIDDFRHGVVAQALRDFLDLFDRVGERRDAGGVDRLHLLDEAEEFIELAEHVLGVGVGHFESRQVRDAFHIGQGQGHAITGKTRLRSASKAALRRGVGGCDPTLKNRGRSGKNTARFDSNTVKL